MTDAGLRFVGAVTGGIAIGLLVGYIVYRLRRPLNNPRAEIALSLMTAYFAYIPAELVGASAVIAAVTAGIYLGWHAPELMRPETRLQSLAVWEILVFLINAFLFALVGLQLPVVLDGLQGESAGSLLGYAAAICATVIVVRFVWVFPATYLPRLMSRRLRERDPYPPWQYPTLISWIGMRGAVTLAAALAVPQLTDAGDPFPGRNLIIFLAFCVILFTLVVQGLSLPGVIRMLGLESDSDAEREESLARIRAAEAAVDRLAELEAEEWVREDTAQRIRGLYSFRASRFTARLDATDDGTIEQRSLAYQRLRHELLNAERGSGGRHAPVGRDLGRGDEHGDSRPRPRGRPARRVGTCAEPGAVEAHRVGCNNGVRPLCCTRQQRGSDPVPPPTCCAPPSATR